MKGRGSRFRRAVLLLAAAAVFVAMYAGCSKFFKPDTPAVSAPPTPSYFTHTVKWSGESVSIIAAWYTGDLQNWKLIAQANPALNPNLVYPGLKVLVPEDIMKTHDPMPKDFVDSYYPRPKANAPPKQGDQGKDEEPRLFGPK